MISKIKQLIFLFGVLLWLSVFWKQSPFPLELRIAACDVGQGDAILITYGQRHILIDAGRNNEVLECLRQEVFWGNKTIDVALVTHWDEDHIGGFPLVLNEYAVRLWLVNPTVASTQKAQQLFSQIKDSVIFPIAGDEIVFPGIRIRILWSEASRQGIQYTREGDQNQQSIAVLIQTESFGFFGTGDLECPEQLAIKDLQLLDSPQIIKIAHHGAKNGLCPEVLQGLRPEVGIISVGEGNSYDHPHTETLQILDTYGVFLRRTDVHGQSVMVWGPHFKDILLENPTKEMSLF